MRVGVGVFSEVPTAVQVLPDPERVVSHAWTPDMTARLLPLVHVGAGVMGPQQAAFTFFYHPKYSLEDWLTFSTVDGRASFGDSPDAVAAFLSALEPMDDPARARAEVRDRCPGYLAVHPVELPCPRAAGLDQSDACTAIDDAVSNWLRGQGLSPYAGVPLLLGGVPPDSPPGWSEYGEYTWADLCDFKGWADTDHFGLDGFVKLAVRPGAPDQIVHWVYGQ